MVLQEDEGSSPVSQRAAGVTFHYWGRIFTTIAKFCPAPAVLLQNKNKNKINKIK